MMRRRQGETHKMPAVIITMQTEMPPRAPGPPQREEERRLALSGRQISKLKFNEGGLPLTEGEKHSLERLEFMKLMKKEIKGKTRSCILVPQSVLLIVAKTRCCGGKFAIKTRAI